MAGTAKEFIHKRKEGVFAVLKQADRMVTPKINELLDSDIDNNFRETVRYQASTGGKKLRAALVLLSCLGCGGRIKDAIYPAAGIEILHNDTLMIDDIIDHSDRRRGKMTAWKKYGSSIIQCLSFIYSASAFRAPVYSPAPKAVNDSFSHALKTVSQGEILDILMEQAGREQEKYVHKNRRNKVRVDDYLQMVSQKTASLIRAASEIGGLCARASQDRLKALKEYGYNLGVSFQIRDDILDIYGKKAKFGKRIGQDIYEGKLGNIVIIYALEELDNKNKASLLNILKKKTVIDNDAAKAIAMIKRTGAKEKAMALADKYNNRGFTSLKKLPDNEYIGVLKDFLEFVSVREI